MIRPQKPQYFVRRNGVIYFRIAVPTALRSKFGCKEFKISLKTEDGRQGRNLCRLLGSKFENLFYNALNMPELKQEELHNLARSYFRDLLVEGNDLVFKIQENVLGMAEDRDEFIDHNRVKEERLRAMNVDGTAEKLFQKPTEILLTKNNLPVDRGSDSFGILTQYLIRAQIENMRVLRAKLEHNYSGTTPTDPIFAGIIDDTLPSLPEYGLGAPNAQTIGQLVTKFMAIHSPSWGYKTRLDFQRMLGCFEEWFGSKRPITSITTPDIGTYRDMLIILPRRYDRKAENKLTLTEVIKNPEKKPLLKPQSAEKYLNLTKSFLNWCLKEGHIEKIPGKNININYTIDEKPRLPFEQVQLVTLFRSPIWTGCHSPARRSKPGNMIIQSAYYWIPLLGVYTGMRCGEIVQLRHKDIRNFDGIQYIDVNDDVQKKLKTKYSTRRIPLHPKLLEWGFAQFLKERSEAAKDERIFWEVSISKQGDPSHAYSKTFSRYLKDIGVKTDYVSFHSFRHCFTDACDNASLTEPQIKAMMGHSDGSASAQYGKGASIPVLFEGISRIVYDFEVDFTPDLPLISTVDA